MCSQVIIAVQECSFADEEVTIRISNLDAGQQVTLHATQKNDFGKAFTSFAFYVADYDGTVDLTRDAALEGGSYSGLEPMGLFWSLSRRGFSTLFKYHVQNPCIVTLKIYNGHIDIKKYPSNEKLMPLATKAIQREYIGPHLRRIEVNDRDICGVLFAPSKEKGSKFPAVIDIGGILGGVVEYRGALLAQKGFVVLCLRIFEFPRTPYTSSVVDLEVVERSAQYLLNHKNVGGFGIGVIGVSYGGTVALAAASCIRHITCAVCFSATIFSMYESDIKYKNRLWKPVEDRSDLVMVKDNVEHRKEALQVPDISVIHDYIPEFEKSHASMLFIYGEEDHLLNWKKYVPTMRKMMHASGKRNYHINIYSGAGHMIMPPFTPLIPTAFLNPKFKYPFYLGGTARGHAHSQERAWKDAVNFLKTNLDIKSRL